MSRYNNPQAQPPQRSQAGPHPAQPQAPYEPDLNGWGGQPAPRQNGRQMQPRSAQQPFGQAGYASDGEYQQRDPYAALRTDGYQQPQPGQPQHVDPYGGYQPTQPAAVRAPQVGYSQGAYPQQDPYAALSGTYGAPHGQQAHGQQAQGYGAPASFQPAPEAYPPRSDFRQSNYDAWQQPQSPQGYDSTQPLAPAYGDGYGDYQNQPFEAQLQGGGAQHWGPADPYAAPGLEPSFEPQHGAFGAAPQPGQPGFFEQSYAEEQEEYEEEPPRRSWTKIAAIVGMFVVLGGGFTYAYNTLLGGPSSPKGGTPVVKGDEGPFKVKPSDPGGKQFAHSDSKVMGRLGDGGAAPTAQASGQGSGEIDPATGVRKVPTLVVGRDGTIQAPPAASPPPATTTATVSVPGLTVIGGLDTPSAPQQSGPRPQDEKTVTAADPQTPVVVSPPAAPEKSAPPEKRKPNVEAAAVLPAQAPEKKAPAKKVAAAPTTPGVSSAGYVVVLASVPASANSRMDALKQFADMQQKYGDILQDKMPDVREADLGEKGTYHRLLVGPPGSRELASQLCTQLKAQGYPSCWVTAY